MSIMSAPKDDRREGDPRPLRHDRKIPLTWWPAEDRPVRWLPKHGQPYCVAEWFTQSVVRFCGHIGVYTGIVVTLMMIVIVFHPFGLGR